MNDNAPTERKPAPVNQAVLVMQGLAIILLLVELLLPETPMPFFLLLAGFVVWLAVGMQLLAGRMLTVRNLLLIAGCVWLMLQPPTAEWTTAPGIGSEAILVSVFAWIFCLIAVQEGVIFGFPMAMLAVITASVMPNPDSSVWFLAVAALLLLASGGLIFIDSLTHPQVKAARISRNRVLSLSPPFLVAVVAFVIMLMTTDLARTVASHVIQVVPLPDNGSRNHYSLVTAPPKFSGEIICRIFTVEGPLPKYLGEKVFWSYEDGIWRDGQPCHQGQIGYGGQQHTAQPYSVHQGVCMVHMQAGKGDELIPFGALPKTQTQEQNSSRKMQRFIWNARHVPAGSYQPPAVMSNVEKLYKLRMTARQICYGAKSDEERVQHILAYLKRLRYDVSTSFQPEGTMDPVEYFLFYGRKGWCVHFATAAVLMLRAVDIPARMVVGYTVDHSGKTNIVRDSAGHAWGEALITVDGVRRWLVVDPSARPMVQAPLREKRLKMFLVIAGAGVVALFMFRKEHHINVRDLREELEREDGNLSDVQKVRAAYERCLRMFARGGLVKPATMPARRFASTVVPRTCRDDFMVITEAFERVTYMGYIHLGSESDTVRQAQCRLLNQASLS